MKTYQFNLKLSRCILDENGNQIEKKDDVCVSAEAMDQQYKDLKELNIDLNEELIRKLYQTLVEQLINEKEDAIRN